MSCAPFYTKSFKGKVKKEEEHWSFADSILVLVSKKGDESSLYSSTLFKGSFSCLW